MLHAESNCTRPKYVCGNERIKLVGAIDGGFPDFGHHLEKEMGGLWLYPVKLLDGFWMRVTDKDSQGLVDGYMTAGEFHNYPHKNVFVYSGSTMGHTPVVITRSQMIPDGIAGLKVTYDFFLPKESAQGKGRRLAADFLFRINLRPDWLAENMEVKDGRDILEWDEKDHVVRGKDEKNPWYVMIGSSGEISDCVIGNEFGGEITESLGGSCRMSRELCLEPGEHKQITFYVAGSFCSGQDCEEQYRQLCSGADYEGEKASRLERLTEQTRLDLGGCTFAGSRKLEEIFDWIKIHTDWLTLKVDGIGRGVTAGIPEYVWWFGCDSCYALQGMMMQGQFELCRDTIRLILEYSKKYNGNGKIIHELLPNGFCPNTGNTQETAHFIILLWEYYQWTGDKEILSECFDYIRMGVKWLKDQDEDGDFFPTGYGIIEIAGLNMEMIDTAVYTCCAYRCFGRIAETLGQSGDVKAWMELADQAQKAVNEKLWAEEEGLFCDCFASPLKISEKRDIILDRMEQAGEKVAKERFLQLLAQRCESGGENGGQQEYGWVLNKNWVINVPMEMGIADRNKAERALERMDTAEFVGECGMYLEGLLKGAAMTISTGVMAVAQARYGHADRAFSLIERMFGTFGAATPGSISEMSPDYGCFVQAWTAYGAVVPVVKYFFGIQPDAEEGKIRIAPMLPKAFEPAEGKSCGLERVRVLDGEISIRIRRENGRSVCEVENQTSAQVDAECSGMEVRLTNSLKK